MTINYTEIINAALALQSADATYGVQFYRELEEGWAYEFNPYTDAVQKTARRTGRIKVAFNPIRSTMAFPEDANRPTQYVMSIEKARELYKKLTAACTPNYWFALDPASYAEHH